MIRISIVLVSLIYLLGSCRATKKIQSAIVKKDSVVVAIPPISNGRDDSIAFIKENFNQIQKNRIDFTIFKNLIIFNNSRSDGFSSFVKLN